MLTRSLIRPLPSAAIAPTPEPAPDPVEYAGPFIAASMTDADPTVRHLEHANSAVSFFHAGKWWAAFPSADDWFIHRFDGPLPAVGAQGGWTAASLTLLNVTANKRGTLAYDAVNGVAWFLAFSLSTTHTTYLLKLTYNAGTDDWTIAQTINIRPGALTGNQWYGHRNITLGLDRNGVPLLTTIGSDAVSPGLHIGFPTNAGFTTWGQLQLDADTTRTGEDSAADLVHFTQGGVHKVGVAYSRNSTTTDGWAFASHAVEADPANYASGWTVETITTAVGIDDHISVVSDGATVFALAKDAANQLWLLRGVPGSWQAPMSVVGSALAPSRGSLFLDDAGTLHAVMQENTNSPYGRIYHKTFAKAAVSVDDTTRGTVIITEGATPNMIDPKRPAMIVGADTDRMAFVFAKNITDGKIWYCRISAGE